MRIKRLKFWLIFFIGGALLYLGQRFFWESTAALSHLDFSYSFNFALSFLLMILLILLRRKAKDQLGFVFLLSSSLKIGIFLLCLKYLGVDLEKKLLPIFFIPYVFCLIAEVWLAASLLKNYNPKGTNNIQ